MPKKTFLSTSEYEEYAAEKHHKNRSAKGFFAPCQEYVDGTKGFGGKDVLLALSVFFAVLIMLRFALRIDLWLDLERIGDTIFLHQTLGYFFVLPFSAVSIGLVLLLVKIKRQKMPSLNINKSSALKSIGVGLVCCAVLYLLGLRPVILDNADVYMVSTANLFLMVLLTAGLVEELVFRAYIGPRFYNIFTNKFLSVLLVGILFALMHLAYLIGLQSLAPSILINVAVWSLYHFVFHWHYAKFNSIWGPILLHTYFSFTGATIGLSSLGL